MTQLGDSSDVLPYLDLLLSGERILIPVYVPHGALYSVWFNSVVSWLLFNAQYF